MEKKEGPVQAACCKGSVPAESRLAAPLPQTLAALPAPEPMLAPARTASGVFHFQRRMPDSHAPPYPTGPSPPALA